MSEPTLSLVGKDDPPSLETSVGEVLGSYRLEKLLGAGAMGRVFLGRHVRLNRAVALKVLHDKHIRDAALVQRFLQEARTVNEINHHHIVEVHDFVEALIPERVYCVMELLEGETLSARLERGGVSLEDMGRICRQIASALGAAHQVGVVHRDVKPDNIFLANRGEQRDYVKVLDFGVAKLITNLGQASAVDTLTGAVVGTPRYMAPEQAAGLEVDSRADVYALGVILYEMLAGRPPFEATTFGQLSADIITRAPPPLPAKTPSGERVPDAWRDLVLASLAKAPDERPPTMADFVSRLGLSSESSVAPAPQRRSKVPWLVAGLGLALAVTAATFALRPPTEAATVVVKVPVAAPPAPKAPEAPEAPKPPPTVTLSLATTPAGATVRRKDTGAVLGKTPLTWTPERADKPLPLVFELSDYESLEKDVPLDGNGAFELTLKRKKKAKVVQDGVLDPFAD